MQSMTGFGRGTARSESWSAAVEASSVNRKQAEIVVQLPREAQELEHRVRTAAQDRVSRGRVQIAVRLEPSAEMVPDVQVNAGLAKALHQALTTLGTAIGEELRPTAGDYLRQNGILTLNENTIDPDAVWLAVEPALDEALCAMIAMRTTEGGHLRSDFLKRLATLERFAVSLAEGASGRTSRQRESLLKRLRDAGLEINLDDERVLRELALFADRCDISEELTRLHSHFHKFREYLDGSEPAGRPLDFLCQELFREFNTIGSKANDAGIAQTIVEAKTELEKIREQVQNVE